MAGTGIRIKQEKAGQLDCARSKLDGVLQHLMEKTDESPTSSEDESSKASPDLIKKEPSPVTSPAKKPAHRTQRKRRRKDDVTTKNTNSYVLKLYDRSVDLAQFSEDTPLYPVCRSWIHNQPHCSTTVVRSRSPSPHPDSPEAESEEDTKLRPVYILPPPTPVPKDKKNMRLPSPIPQPQEEFVVSSDENTAPSRESLLAKHMERWKAVRQKWKEAATLNEERYKDSNAILKAMFERSVCRDEGNVSESWNGVAAAT